MAGITVKLVHVGDNHEIERAHVNEDNSVTYSQEAEALPSLFEHIARDYPKKLDNLGIANLLNKDGWSNGYIMIERAS